MDVARTGKNYFKEWRWLLGLGLLTAVFFIFLEHVSPYFFLEDDNRDYSLPLLVHFYRALAGGEIGQFNFHQFLGNPCLASSPVFYPPMYFSVWLSKLFTGDVQWSMDIFAFLHTLVSAPGMYFFLRKAGLGEKASFWGGAALAINTYTAFVGASWWIIFPVLGFIGWLNYLLLCLAEAPTLYNMLLLTAVRVALFYSGYAQYFLYEFLMEALLALLIFRKKPWDARAKKFVFEYVYGVLLTSACALPLVLPTMAHMALSADRSTALVFGSFTSIKYRIDLWLLGQVYPFFDTLLTQNQFLHWRLTNPGFAAFMIPYTSHTGYVSLAAVILLLCKYRAELRARQYFMPLALCAGMALLWASGALNHIIYLLPLLNRFRWTFKVGIFVTFYTLALAACGLDTLLNATADAKRRNTIFTLAVALTFLDLGILYAGNYQHSFIRHDVPNPIAEPLQKELSDGRIFTLGYMTGADFDPGGIGFNYATQWGLYHFAGYDSFVTKNNFEAALKLNYISSYCGIMHENAIKYYRNWGIKYYVVKRSKAAAYAEQLAPFGIMPRYEDARRVVFFDPQAKPLVYRDGDDAPVNFTAKTNRLDFETDFSTASTVAAAFLYNPNFTATLDGAPAPVVENRLHQLSLSVPSGKHSAAFIYRDPKLALGFYLGLLGLAALALLRFFAKPLL
jgi:hypothetical protein